MTVAPSAAVSSAPWSRLKHALVRHSNMPFSPRSKQHAVEGKLATVARACVQALHALHQAGHVHGAVGRDHVLVREGGGEVLLAHPAFSAEGGLSLSENPGGPGTAGAEDFVSLGKMLEEIHQEDGAPSRASPLFKSFLKLCMQEQRRPTADKLMKHPFVNS